VSESYQLETTKALKPRPRIKVTEWFLNFVSVLVLFFELRF